MRIDRPIPSLDPDTVRNALYDAAAIGTLAPSIFNTQPWRWVLTDGRLLLRADRDRQVPAIDPGGRLLILSCGASLHHAYTDLRGAGYRTHVRRRPDPNDADTLATLSVTGNRRPDPTAARYAHAARQRRTDRRPFQGSGLRGDALAELLSAGRLPGVSVHAVAPQSRVFLATAAYGAATIEERDEAYRAALAEWVDRGPADGVPTATLTGRQPRPVSVRDFASGPLDPAGADDSGATYLVIATRKDGPLDWLKAGEATSGVLLAATHLELGASPMSDVVEVAGARALVRSIVPDRWWPQLVVRIGTPAVDQPAPAAPRRSELSSIQIRC